MKKQLKLSELKIQSFQTSEKTVVGGGTCGCCPTQEYSCGQYFTCNGGPC
ncbi:MAG: hypothetical protein QNK37_19780 [Acidobacteriota bacterium]|nr:hypothetical protein [Acidobacteriota bacterium]